MKKLLLTLLTAVMTVGAWAQDPEPDPNWTVTTFSGSISSNSTTINDATWSLSDMTVGSDTNGQPAWSISGGKWKFGSGKSQFWSSYTLSTNKFNSYNITKVEIGCYDNGGATSSVTVKQGDITIGSETVSTTTTSNVETLNETSGAGGVLQIVFNSDKQASYITSIKVWYSMPDNAINVESVSLDLNSLNIMEGKKATLNATVFPVNATNQNISWSSSDEEVAIVNGGIVKGVKAGTATITVTTEDGSLTDECVVTVTPKTAPVGAAFYESFDKLEGTGGNDDVWSGISGTYAWASSDCDNSGWTTEGTLNKGYKCASIRKGTSGSTSISSGLTTPTIGVAGNGNLTFNAQAWGTDTGDFYVEIKGGGTFTSAAGVTLSNNNATAKVVLTKTSEWGDYDLSFTGLTADSKFRFYMAAGKRGFLDEVAVFVTPTTGEIAFVATDGNDEYYATFSSDKAVAIPIEDANGVMYEVYAVNVENDAMYLYDFSETIGSVDGEGNIIVPANTGVLVMAAATAAPTMTYSFTEEAGATDDIEAVNMLRPASEAKTGDYKFYMLNYASENAYNTLGFYYGAEDGVAFDSREGSAYLAVPATTAARARGFALNHSTTDIKEVNNTVANNVTYNLAGQRVNAYAKGIVVVNGKKVVK